MSQGASKGPGNQEWVRKPARGLGDSNKSQLATGSELLVGPNSRSQEASNESGSLGPRCHESWEPGTKVPWILGAWDQGGMDPGSQQGAREPQARPAVSQEPAMCKGARSQQCVGSQQWATEVARKPAINQGASSESESQEPVMTGSQQKVKGQRASNTSGSQGASNESGSQEPAMCQWARSQQCVREPARQQKVRG